MAVDDVHNPLLAETTCGSLLLQLQKIWDEVGESRLYAMERGLKIPQSERTKTTSSLLVSLIKQLEKDKKSLQLGPDDHLHLEGFASNVFAKADKQDRAGKADLSDLMG
ncbi:putative vacuolar protein sorting-associate protein Vta1/Callose synthase [Helianthus annuus]|nr:putative vacuolar protein sorting-associate protein Vta1/Callose synthase [Helianthus annuus]